MGESNDLSYQGNANPNHAEIPSYPSQSDFYPESGCWQGFREKESLYPDRGNVNWCSHYGNPQEKKYIKNRAVTKSNHTFLSVLWEDHEATCYRETCTTALTMQHSQQPLDRIQIEAVDK